MKLRHEIKYIISSYEKEVLKHRISQLTIPDSHSDEKNNTGYVVTSLYFDDLQNSCMKENENGFDKRSKYRIRIYDNITDVIKLERKSKISGLTEKTSVLMEIDSVREFLKAKYEIKPIDTEAMILFKAEMSQKKLLPVVVVEYRREAYVDPFGNVRITFDSDIRCSDNIDSFPDNLLLRDPVLPSNQHVLEIKYTDFFPEYLRRAFDIGAIRQTTYSKYYFSRKGFAL